ncbi:TPA: hypothetical protein LA460_000250 [Clostridium botulinum]|nr:hypothetical protein [Clostridium botulinum]HBJ1652854.1 hypothetical protein [Clostridium botulinum]
MEELSKQINLYSVDTKAFYTANEKNYSDLKAWSNSRINSIKKYLQVESHNIAMDNKEMLLEIAKYDYRTRLLQDGYSEIESLFITNKEFNDEKFISNILNDFSKMIYDLMIKKHKKYDYYKQVYEISKENFNSEIESFEGIRKLRKYYLNDRNKIALFDSSLTRCMNFEINKTTTDILVIRPYHYIILNQIIKNGYNYNNKHFIFFTASAGQIRTKKCVFINEKLWVEKEKTILCGLTKDKMNNSNQKGMNLTKYMAYVALNSSATTEWKEFDIDKSIVIKDYEGIVKSNVDYIDVKKIETAKAIEECIERKKMDVPIPYSDGCGWIRPDIIKKNFMVRLPWIKGLLTPCRFIQFCKTERTVDNEEDRYKIIDWWGNEHDLIKEDIQVIFTESQFKAIKYYKDWEEYKKYFKEYNCMASICNMEADTKDFRQASLNYQMLQTITDITDEEIEHFTNPIDEYITNGYTNIKNQLDILGCNKYYKTNLQKALCLYPEMIQESYVKSMLSDNLNKKKKQAKFGKFKVDAKYTFAIPDIYAWMENVFNNVENPKGILTHAYQSSCRLYKNVKHIVTNRSPHLYRELGIRINVINNKTKKWFITDGCYTSSHDLITKLLQNDNDGDKYLVIADQVYYNVAKRNMKGIVPLYYEMSKASPQEINSDNIYTSLINGYKFGNVGIYSNKITVMFNEKNIDLNAIKLLTCLNNFFIDGAKTGIMYKPSDAINDRIKIANGKLPYFFQFAKDKKIEQVKPINNSTVNRVCKKIEEIKQQKYEFAQHGAFRYKILYGNKDIEINEELVQYYLKLDKEKNMVSKNSKVESDKLQLTLVNNIKDNLISKSKELSITYKDMVNMIIKYIYEKHKNQKKTLLWDIFGEDIIDNLKSVLRLSLEDKNVKMCECCGKRFKIESKTYEPKYCSKCAKKIKNEQNKKYLKEK